MQRIFKKSGIYKNKKTGKTYKVLFGGIINCTNAQDGQEMVLYTNLEGEKEMFVREVNEFFEKFE